MSLLVESAVVGGTAASDLDKVLSSGVTFKVAGSDDSSESSSIGAPSDGESGSGGDDDDDDDDEVQSTLSLDDLERSLPSKKGLSTFYGGRSKSYGNLSEVKSVSDIEKPDNPFNKRRRNLLAHKLSSWSTSSSTSSPSKRKRRMMMKDSRTSFYGHGNPISMPLLPVHEHDDDEDDDEDEDDDMDGDGGRKNDAERCDLRLGLNGGSRFCI